MPGIPPFPLPQLTARFAVLKRRLEVEAASRSAFLWAHISCLQETGSDPIEHLQGTRTRAASLRTLAKERSTRSS